MESVNVLEVRNVKKSFPGTMALKGVSLQLGKGEIRAVVGENGAGKSTLMNVISGVLPYDEGEVLIHGEKVSFRGPADASQKGVGFVHQELALCTSLTVAQNVFMGRLPQKNGIIDKKKLYHDTEELLKRFNVSFGPNDRLTNLSVAEQQIVEIAHALSANCDVIIFDEPTSSLNEAEAEGLFQVIRKLREEGLSIIYISHKLSEVFTLCDTVTVMRDGHVINTFPIKDVTPEYITSEMVGRELNNLYPPKSVVHDGEELLRVEGFTCYPKVIDASFTLRKGEILGLSGLLGCGRSELVRAVCAIDPCQKGEVFIDGQHVKFSDYKDALKHRICYLTEDRKFDGLFLGLSLRDNMSVMVMEENSTATILNHKKLSSLAKEYSEKMNIKSSGISQTVGDLSGGNQQKVMIAKLLAMHPKVIILDEPTRGIDVGAKYEIHSMLRQLCNDGMGVIVISSEFPEIVGLCDRVVVMHEGKTVAELAGDEVTQDNLIHCASGMN